MLGPKARSSSSPCAGALAGRKKSRSGQPARRTRQPRICKSPASSGVHTRVIDCVARGGSEIDTGGNLEHVTPLQLGIKRYSAQTLSPQRLSLLHQLYTIKLDVDGIWIAKYGCDFGRFTLDQSGCDAGSASDSLLAHDAMH